MSVAFLDWIVGAAEVSFSSRAVWLHRRHVPTSDAALEDGNCSLIFLHSYHNMDREGLESKRRASARGAVPYNTNREVSVFHFVHCVCVCVCRPVGESVLLGLVASGANYPVLLQSLL